MRTATLALALLAGCHAGVGPSAGVSLTRGGMLLGWEATATAVLGVAGGQTFRRDRGWRRTSWGALALELPWLDDGSTGGVPVPLGQALAGGAEGDGSGYLIGLGAGGLVALDRCSGPFAIDALLSLRRAGGDTQLSLVSHAGLLAWPCR